MSDATPKGLQFRLAFREEGDWISVYIASAGTMADAQLVARIWKPLVARPDLWQAYLAFHSLAMRAAGIDMAPPEPAPEHERAGHS